MLGLAHNLRNLFTLGYSGSSDGGWAPTQEHFVLATPKGLFSKKDGGRIRVESKEDYERR